MGAYLSEPITKKQSCDGANKKLSYGVSGMQGWRVSMEDAHSCILDYDDDISLFAVYDGHGGSEVATYTAENLPDFLKTTDEYKAGNLKGCLVNGFLGFDQQLLTDKVMTKLRDLAGMNNTEAEEDEVDSLTQEAEIPMNELLSKLKEGGYHMASADIAEDGESSKENSKNYDVQSNGKSPHGGETSKHIQEDSRVKDKIPSGDVDKETKEEQEDVGGKENEEKTSKDQDDSEKIDEETVKEKEEGEEEVEQEGEGDDEEEPEEEDDEEEDEDEDDDDDDDDDEEEEGRAHWGDGDEVGYDSGTTAVVALLRKDRLVVGNVGDSRCVLCRNGIAIDMSMDHKPENDKELTRIKNAGGRVTGEGRVNGGLNLSRAIGDHRYKSKSDLGADEQQITAMPDVIETEITEADKFVVLACDGIWNVLSSQEVVDFVSERLEKQCETGNVSLSEICEELFDKCLASDTSGDGTGCDNMTAIIVLLTDPKDFNRKTKRKLREEAVDTDSSSKKARTE